MPSLEKLRQLVKKKTATPDRRFEFRKSGTFHPHVQPNASIVGMRVSNADCLPARIHG